MIDGMLEYYKMIKDNNIDIIYSGSIWADGIEKLGTKLRSRMVQEDLSLSASQSVFSVFVEQMNNMLMYSAEKGLLVDSSGESHDSSKGVFIMGSENKMYFVQSGNLIRHENVDLIKSRIDYLNTLDKKEIRQYYKEQIKAENLNPESKGAGLGLIEIARRAGSPIEYSFVPFNEEFSFFTMFVTISRGGN